jgi:hypothetical protein
VARPGRVSDSELRESFERLKAGARILDETKRLHIRPSTLHYHYRRLNGGTLRLVRRLAPSLTVPNDQTVLAYMAGIIDGEGTIGRNGSRLRNWPWHITFSNTEKAMIDFFAAYGGLVSKRHDKSLRGGTIKSVKPQWNWRVCRAVDVLALAVALQPYLIVKRHRADECIRDLSARLARTNNDGSAADKPLGRLALPV